MKNCNQAFKSTEQILSSQLDAVLVKSFRTH